MLFFLIGFMGSGKTTIGRDLAELLDFEYIDTDNLIEEMYKLKTTAIFSKYGETVFRKAECIILEEIVNHDNLVVATGGGLPCFKNNMKLMNKNGITIYLNLTPEVLFERLKWSKNKRPLIKGMTPNELKEYININLPLREKFYNESKIIFNVDNDDIIKPEDIIKKIDCYRNSKTLP